MCARVCVCVYIYRVQQLEEENGEMMLNVCRLKSQTEKLDQVSVMYLKDNSLYFFCSFGHRSYILIIILC